MDKKKETKAEIECANSGAIEQFTSKVITVRRGYFRMRINPVIEIDSMTERNKPKTDGGVGAANHAFLSQENV